MTRSLRIVKFNTRLGNEKIEELGELVMKAMREVYLRYEIYEELLDEKNRDIFTMNLNLSPSPIINGNLDEGIHKRIGNLLNKDENALIITDMMICCYGYRVGGVADKNNKTALVTTKEIPRLNRKDEMLFLPRLFKVCLHEIGHLYNIYHHITRIGRGKYCPMINKSFEDEQVDWKKRRKFLDSKGEIFCEECYTIIQTY